MPSIECDFFDPRILQYRAESRGYSAKEGGAVSIAIPVIPKETRQLSDIALSPFYQDRDGWTDPQTGFFYPPTFNYIAVLTAIRKHDHQNFYVHVNLYRPKDAPEIWEHLLSTEDVRIAIDSSLGHLELLAAEGYTRLCPSS